MHMRMVLKTAVAVATVAVGLLMGIYVLDYEHIWTVTLFAAACYGMGHSVYWILRKIDKRYPKSLNSI